MVKIKIMVKIKMFLLELMFRNSAIFLVTVLTLQELF